MNSQTKTLYKRYKDELIFELKKELDVNNIHSIPKVIQVTVNMGLNVRNNKKSDLIAVRNSIKMITGQEPKINLCRKSIAGFKVRKGFPIGSSVHLHGENMYNFLEMLVSVVLPRVRDFKGLSLKSFDGRGNYNIGIKDLACFKELEYEEFITNGQTKGIDIAITTSAKDNHSGQVLLQKLGFPFIIKPQKV